MKHRTTMRLTALVAGLGMLALPVGSAWANGIAVTNTSLWNADLGAKSVYVQFDVSWSNAWRTAVNWDAAWVFVKFQAPGSNNWQHATLSTNDADHIPAGGGVVDATADGKGVFIYRTDTAAGGNCNYDACTPDGPFRVGIYATASSGREQAGAGYYGVLELSGNLWERCMTVGSPNGRNFIGTHGSGALDASGNATNSDWYIDVSGAGFRGGEWGNSASFAPVSDRVRGARVRTDRGSDCGWRAGRLAP